MIELYATRLYTQPGVPTFLVFMTEAREKYNEEKRMLLTHEVRLDRHAYARLGEEGFLAEHEEAARKRFIKEANANGCIFDPASPLVLC